MKTCLSYALFLATGFLLTSDAFGQTNWEAFNDHRAGASTSPFATSWELRGNGSGGVLKNITTGDFVAATLVVEEEGPGSDDFGICSDANAGSPAALFFAGKCTIGGVGNDGIVGIRNNEAEVLRLRFIGLDPAKRYKFRGTSARGGNYNDRWAIFKIVEADGAVAAHVDGSPNRNLFTVLTFPASGIQADEVALNTGDNKAGSLVGWDNINPGADGTFAVEGRQYVGISPFGNPPAGPYGYGFNVIYLAEVEATGGVSITANPEDRLVPAGTTAQFTVGATSAGPITYQWQSTTPGGDVFSNIAGANSATYTTPVLTVAQDNTKFRARVTSGPDSATSGEATLRVDGILPALASVTGSINFNAVYLTFSEPMNAETATTAGNYTIDNSLTVSAATVLDPQTVKLSTSTQTSGQTYKVTVNNVTDVAGNPVPANSSGTFTGFAVVSGTAGLEIWHGVTGDLASFLVDPRYPGNPDRDMVAPALDSTTVWPDGPFNTYGGRLRAWVSPPVDGFYYFFLKSDNVGQLSISPDDSFANLAVIASDTDAANGFQEPGSPATSTDPIMLLAGQRYAIEAVWEEDNGTDFCQVAWREVDDPTPADLLLPISGSALSYYGPSGVGAFTGISTSGGQLTVTWVGNGVLQSSSNLASWADIPGAASPYTTPMSPLKSFFRLRQ